MTQEEKITDGLDKDLIQLIDAEMNDPVIGKLLNRNAAYVLGKEIKLVLIERACEWLKEEYPKAAAYYEHPDSFIDQFKEEMKGD